MINFGRFEATGLKFCRYAGSIAVGASLMASPCYAEDINKTAPTGDANRSKPAKQFSSNTRGAREKTEVDVTSPYASFRLGFVVSPILSIQGGLDVVFPRFAVAKGWTTRVDGEFSARLNSPSFGSRRDSVFSLNFCQAYSQGEFSRSKFYLGGGVGIFFGPFKGALGGKLFVGSHLSQTVSFELQALFPGETSPQIGVGVRISVF